MDSYRDIIDLEHPDSKTHPRMPMANRAAQFAPFAALTGYEEAIAETGRLTESRLERSDDDNHILNERIHQLIAIENSHPEVTLTFFERDPHKEGGRYLTVTGKLKRIDETEGLIILDDGLAIAMSDLLRL